MLYETIQIWDKHPEATLTSYSLTSDDELRYPPLPTVLVCPGGGYSYLSSREAEPIAIQFLKEGYNVFVLMYSVGEGAADYVPAIEVALAIKYIRGRPPCRKLGRFLEAPCRKGGAWRLSF